MSTAAAQLSGFPLFEDCRGGELAALAADMATTTYEAGAVLMTEGEIGEHFALVVEGRVTASSSSDGQARTLGSAGPGSVLGELAMLLAHGRMATVVADTPVTVLTGDARAFGQLLELPGVYDRLTRLVSTRLAEDVAPVPIELADGSPVLLRPLVPSDRAIYTAAVRDLSRESLRLRFFTGGQPNERTLEYLINISYTDHFAWALVDPARTEVGVAVGRYIRDKDKPDHADLAFGVSDDYQGRGIGTLLLGALAAAAPTAGLEVFTAEVLADNLAMRTVLRKAGARFRFEEPGVVSTAFPVVGAAGLLDPDLMTTLERAAHDIVTAGGLALTQPPS